MKNIIIGAVAGAATVGVSWIIVALLMSPDLYSNFHSPCDGKTKTEYSSNFIQVLKNSKSLENQMPVDKVENLVELKTYKCLVVDDFKWVVKNAMKLEDLAKIEDCQYNAVGKSVLKQMKTLKISKNDQKLITIANCLGQSFADVDKAAEYFTKLGITYDATTPASTPTASKDKKDEEANSGGSKPNIDSASTQNGHNQNAPASPSQAPQVQGGSQVPVTPKPNINTAPQAPAKV